MSDVVITMNKKIDRSTVNNDTTIQLVNNYSAEAEVLTDLKYSDLDAGEKEDFDSLLDRLTWEIEVNAIVWNIVRTGKEFDLTTSYVRDEESSMPPATALTTGQALVVRFEIPGFETGTVRELNLFYNDDFNPAELTDLLDIGITVTGDGSVFTITNTIECKVSFYKPELVVDFYIINDVGQNDIIPV